MVDVTLSLGLDLEVADEGRLRDFAARYFLARTSDSGGGVTNAMETATKDLQGALQFILLQHLLNSGVFGPDTGLAVKRLAVHWPGSSDQAIG